MQARTSFGYKFLKYNLDIFGVKAGVAFFIILLFIFPNSLFRNIVGILFIIFFPGYILSCALFPKKNYLDSIERIILSLIFSIGIVSLLGFVLNFTMFGIRLYPIIVALISFIALLSILAIFRRGYFSEKDLFLPAKSISKLNGFLKPVGKSSKPSNNDIMIKSLALIAFIFIIICLAIIEKTPPASGYELSIYRAYPWYFWFFIMASLSCGIGILVYQSFSQEKSKWWVTGLLIVLFTNTIVLLLPEFRGYVFYGVGDTTKHLGLIKNILSEGHVSKNNFYPIEHILGSILIDIAGIPLDDIPALFSIMFSGIYIGSMYLLAKSLSKISGQIFLTVALASPLIYSFFHANVHTNMLSLFILPCLLYFYNKKELQSNYKVENTIALLLVVFTIVFFHPVTAFYVLSIFITFGVGYYFYLRLPNPNKQIISSKILGKKFLKLSLIVFVTFLMWYLSQTLTQGVFKHVIKFLLGEATGRTSLITHQLSIVSESGLTTIQVIEVFINRYGAVFLLLLVSFLAFIFAMRKNLSRKHNPDTISFSYSLLFLVAISIGFIELSGEFVEYNAIRIARFPLLIGTVLSGIVIYKFIDGLDRGEFIKYKKIFIVFIFIIILVMAGLSIGSVYNSPRVSKFNSQMMEMNIVGTKWFMKSNSDIKVLLNRYKILIRYHDYNFGHTQLRTFKPIVEKENIVWQERLPSHFGYNGNETVAETLGFQDRYIIIFPSDKVFELFYPKDVRKKVTKWTDKDFSKLRNDPTVSHIYSSGDFEVWRVYGGKNVYN